MEEKKINKKDIDLLIQNVKSIDIKYELQELKDDIKFEKKENS